MLILSEFKGHKDKRGVIEEILIDKPFNSVLRITCETDAVRANHYHRADSHWCYLSNGSMFYYERPVGSQDPPKVALINGGDLFFTDSMVEHCMFFTAPSEFWCFSKLSRASADYETDTVRLDFDLSQIK